VGRYLNPWSRIFLTLASLLENQNNLTLDQCRYQITHFHVMIFFVFTKRSLFKQAAVVCLSFLVKLPCFYSCIYLCCHFKSKRSDYFHLIHFSYRYIFLIIPFIYQEYTFLLINSSVLILFLIGKVIAEISAYHTRTSSSAYFLPPLILLPKHLTHYRCSSKILLQVKSYSKETTNEAFKL